MEQFRRRGEGTVILVWSPRSVPHFLDKLLTSLQGNVRLLTIESKVPAKFCRLEFPFNFSHVQSR